MNCEQQKSKLKCCKTKKSDLFVTAESESKKISKNEVIIRRTLGKVAWAHLETFCKILKLDFVQA